MKKINIKTSKYIVDTTARFNKDLKKAIKQGKNIEKLISVVEKIANGEILEEKYKDHNLIDNKKYKNCRECHIEPDWLLIYKIYDSELILVLFTTGSHSDLF